jgi:YD repeat-containing protein
MMTNTVTDPLGRVSASVLSAYGLPVQTVFSSGTNAVTNSMTYLAGLVSPDQEAKDYPATVTDEAGHVRAYTYTALGQLQTATDLGGNPWTNFYDPTYGLLTATASPAGETNYFAYDGLENLKTVTFADGHSLVNNYNSGDNRLGSVDLPSGATVNLLYDAAGRLTNRSSSIGEAAVFQYNGNDMVTVMTDNTGSTINYYDAAGRLEGMDFPAGASVRYGRDNLDRITWITNPATTGGTPYVTHYEYDVVGNLKTITDPMSGQTSFTYDRVNRKTSRTLPNGVVTTYDYDWRDRVTNIVHKIGTTVLASVGYARGLSGEPTEIVREDGTYVLLGYDGALRLTNEVYYNASSIAIATNGYGYDADGNRVSLLTGGVTYTNAVSAGYRVTQVKTNGTTVETYDYDNGGARDGHHPEWHNLKLGV